MYNQTEKVNIRPKSYLPVFRVSEGDVGRTLTAHLVSDEGEISIPGGATVTMAGTKPSGLGYTVTGTVDGTDVSFETDAVMTDEPGRIVSEIRIVQDGTVIGTTNVVLLVEPSPHPDDTTDGRREPLVNEITALLTSITEQANRVEEYSGKVLGMTVTAHESETATVTKTEGEVVNLDFGLPRGPQGPQGIPGEDGQDGVTPDFTIGTVETLAPGEQATATITGTEEDPVLNLGIPRGAKGDKGDPGDVNADGYYPDLYAGGLVTDKGTVDKTPYLFRASPSLGYDYNYESDKIVGGTVAWNQLCNGSSVTVQNGRKYLLKKGTAWSIGASTGTAITGLTNGSDMVIDLTQMFGTTIADYIYSLEQATAGAGVAWFRRYFPEDYYPYSANTLQSVQATAHKTYDGDGNVIGNYALDSSLTLRGIPKLDASNNLYYDGDTYASDGTVTRKYGVVDLGTLDWTYNSTYDFFASSYLPTKAEVANQISNILCGKYTTVASKYAGDVPSLPDKSILVAAGNQYIRVKDSTYTDSAAFKAAMSGVYLVYEKTTPTTETAQPYTNPQTVDPDGTEEYVTSGIVPVGHETLYIEDLKAKLEDLPTIPEAPSTNGTYTLQAVRTASGVTYSWVSG